MSECKTCAIPLSRRNVSGLCRKHFSAVSAANPETRRKQIEGIRRKHAVDPDFKDRLRQRARALGSDKRYTEARSAAFRKGEYWKLGTASQTPETRAKAGRSVSNTVLGWCPPALRQDYRDLVNKYRFKSVEARAMIEEQHELQMARWRRSIGIEVEAERVVIPAAAAPARRPQDAAFELAADLFGVTEDEILSSARDRPFMLARYALAVGLSRAGYTTTGIADALNRTDHSTAINLLKKADELARRDPKFSRMVEQVAGCWACVDVAA